MLKDPAYRAIPLNVAHLACESNQNAQKPSRLHAFSRVRLSRSSKFDCTKKKAAFRSHRDNHVFKKLAALLEPDLTREAAQKLTKEVGQRVGGRGALADFTKTLCLRVSPGVLPPAHVSACLAVVTEGGTDDEGGQATLDLVSDSAAANPYLFAGLSKQVHRLHTLPKLPKLGSACNADRKPLEFPSMVWPGGGEIHL
jgi:hypothetical protein